MASSCLPSSRGQGQETRLWGPLSAFPQPPPRLLQTQPQQQPAAGSWQKLRPAPPRRHALACTSSPGPPATMLLPPVLATAASGPRGTAWAPGKSLEGEPEPGGLIFGLSGARSARCGHWEEGRGKWSSGQGAGQVTSWMWPGESWKCPRWTSGLRWTVEQGAGADQWCNLGVLSQASVSSAGPSPCSIFCDSWHPCSSWLSSSPAKTSGQDGASPDLCLPLSFSIKEG